MATITYYRVEAGFSNRRASDNEVIWRPYEYASDKMTALKYARTRNVARVVCVTEEVVHVSPEGRVAMGNPIIGSK